MWARAALASTTMDGALAADRAGHGRDLGLVAVGADADHLPAAEIDAFEIGEKAVDEVDARLLAVADDVDPGVLLQLHREDGRVDLARRERGAFELPGGPEFLRLGEPEGLRQAAGDGGEQDSPWGSLFARRSRRCERVVTPSPRVSGERVGVRGRASSNHATNRPRPSS